MKDNDVYRFTWSDAERKKAAQGWSGSLDHCFDGQLIFFGGSLYDTYWGFGSPLGDSGRRFSPAEAQARGTLTFVANLDDLEPISEGDYPQYADSDAFNMSNQHGCYRRYFKLKGAKRSVEKQLKILDARILKAKQDAEHAMSAAFRTIESSLTLAAQLAAGEEVRL